MKILVIRFSSFGDCVLLCPFLAGLKEGGAEEVAVVTKSAYTPLFSAVPGVDRVIGLDPAGGPAGLFQIGTDNRNSDYVVIDAHNNVRSRMLSWKLGGAQATIRKHTAARLGRIYLKTRPKLPSIPDRYRALGIEVGLRMPESGAGSETGRPRGQPDLPESVERSVSDMLPDHGGQFIAAAPGSRWPMKKWPISHYQELLARLCERSGYQVLILGDGTDQADAERLKHILNRHAVNLAGRTTMLEAAACLKRCRAFIGNDSGLMHLAELMGVPALALFGPTTDTFGYYPSGPDSKVCERDLNCRPCSKNGSRPCYKLLFRRKQECLTQIPVEAVEKAFEEMIAGDGPRRYLLP